MRAKVVRTSVPDAKAPCPLDRVNHQFKAQRPNRLLVSDFTYVSTCTALSTLPLSSPSLPGIVGWRVSSSMRTNFVLDNPS